MRISGQKQRRLTWIIKITNIIATLLPLFLFTILSVIMLFYLKIDLGLPAIQIIALATGILLPLATLLISEYKKILKYIQKLFFMIIIRKTLNQRMKPLLKSLANQSGLELAMSHFYAFMQYFEQISRIYDLKTLDIEVGEKTRRLIINKFNELRPDKLQEIAFRIPIILTHEDFFGVLEKEIINVHWVLQALLKNGDYQLIWMYLTHCMAIEMTNKYNLGSKQMLDSVNQILYILGIVQNSPIEYDVDTTKSKFVSLIEILTLWVLEYYNPDYHSLTKTQKSEVRKNFLGIISLIDLATRASQTPAFTSATTFLYEKLTNKGNSDQLRLIVRELVELMNYEDMEDFLTSGLKAFAKINLQLDHKKAFFTEIQKEIETHSGDFALFRKLISNIFQYIGVMGYIHAFGSSKSAIVPVGMKVRILPKSIGTFDVNFSDGQDNTILHLNSTQLLFDVNALATAGKLEELEFLSTSTISAIDISLENRDKIRLFAWPFGVTSTKITLMGIWPPTVDSLTFLRVLDENKYYESSIESVVDIGAGSGILGLSFLKYGKAKHVIFTDINEASREWIEANCRANGFNIEACKFIRSKSLDGLLQMTAKVRYDIALLSPPYLPLFMVHSVPVQNKKLDQKYQIAFDEYTIETVDTGLLYDVIVNFKQIANKLIVLYSSIADDIVDNALAYVNNFTPPVKTKVLWEQLVPLKIQGLVPVNDEEYSKWPPGKRALLDDLRKRGRLFFRPIEQEQSYPFWHKIKIVEFF
jgi:16S rRNA G966 N2-methylase RsmD